MVDKTEDEDYEQISAHSEGHVNLEVVSKSLNDVSAVSEVNWPEAVEKFLYQPKQLTIGTVKEKRKLNRWQMKAIQDIEKIKIKQQERAELRNIEREHEQLK